MIQGPYHYFLDCYIDRFTGGQMFAVSTISELAVFVLT